MREIVILSTWHRTLYLQTCFDALYAARGIQERDLWIWQNHRQDADTAPANSIIWDNKPRFPYSEIIGGNFPDWENAHYAAWTAAYNSRAPRVYFFSDDVICTPDFFEWHDAVQADGDWFGSTAWRPPTGNTKPFDLAAYYQISYPNEISMGLCVKRKSIESFLHGWPTQEWLMAHQPKIVMPYVPRCYHIGARSSQLGSVGENNGPAIDVLPNPIPDYGRQNVVLKS
jgi:hypothetical protein